ncbi:MAG TPA: NADH-quinone oxidoreductase subunit M [Thermomicrobiales bacterium]|nr:NADH-quinone oxidoreductase subunit M [Thermomicrobiales bacterium]
MNGVPLLSIITYLPLLGAVILFAVPRLSAAAARWVALVTSLVTLVVSLLLLTGGAPGTAQMQFVEDVNWLPGVGVHYHFGADGLSILLIILTTLLTVVSVLASWTSIQHRVREFFIAMLLLEMGLLGVFVSLDLFLFYVFWELSLIPMALIIGVWGSRNRVYAAIKFFLYTLAGSLLMLVAIVATYQRYYQLTGVRTLDLLKLANPPLQQLGMTSLSQFYPLNFQYWVFAAFFIAFAIKVPMFPVHTWLPDAHTEAPTAGSVMLAGVMLKLGGYGMIRFCLPLFPDAARAAAPYIIVLSAIAIIYGALVALPQPDWKRLVAYSSVSHMGFVTLGIFAFNQQALQGATMVMFAHGLNTSALFFLVGVVYERAHTRLIRAFTGLMTSMPVYASIFGLFVFASIGLPGMTGFVGEFHALMGTFRVSDELARVCVIVSTAVIIFAAWYLLWLYQRVAMGVPPGQPVPAMAAAHGGIAPSGGDHLPQPEPVGALARHQQAEGVERGSAAPSPNPEVGEAEAQHATHLTDVNAREVIALAPLAVLTVLFGMWPGPIFHLVSATLANVLRPFGT